jgi:hypothetical protein
MKQQFAVTHRHKIEKMNCVGYDKLLFHERYASVWWTVLNFGSRGLRSSFYDVSHYESGFQWARHVARLYVQEQFSLLNPRCNIGCMWEG